MAILSTPYIYTRFSTNLQRDSSCEDQEREARQILQKHGIDDSNAIVIHDRAESGTKSQRDGFLQLQESVAQGRVSVVVVDDQARLSRGDDVIGVIKDLVFGGVRFLSGDGVDTDDEGWQLKVRVLGLHNATTIDETARRVRRGQRGRILDDLSAGDFPYGFESYFLDPDYALKFCGRGPKPDKGIRICESESYWVQEIFRLFVEGSSINAIAEELIRNVVWSSFSNVDGPWAIMDKSLDCDLLFVLLLKCLCLLVVESFGRKFVIRIEVDKSVEERRKGGVLCSECLLLIGF